MARYLVYLLVQLLVAGYIGCLICMPYRMRNLHRIIGALVVLAIVTTGYWCFVS